MTRRKALLFYQMIQRYKFHKVPGRKKEKRKKRDGCCNHLVLLIPRPLLFSRNRAALRRLLAVRRGFYPNPRNAPCIKRLHALPKVVGYTLVTRFYTSKSASLNTLSMNLYTANVTSFSGTCKLLLLNIFNSYRLFCLLFFMFATGSETAQ